ncbi:MAG: YhbY family RNA-binding protein [Methanomicrobiales archaeon]|nr:YhbY family RNA-binding protein [Methanomicrobiales archaeon]
MIDRRRINELKPTVWVGKNGCTDVVIEEIRRQVKARGMIKVRWLRNAEINPTHLAGCTGTEILDLRGRTIVLSKKGSGDD